MKKFDKIIINNSLFLYSNLKFCDLKILIVIKKIINEATTPNT